MPVWGSVWLQNANSHSMEQLSYFYDHIMTIMMFLLLMIGYLLFVFMNTKEYSSVIREGQEMEMVWTFIPMVVLFLIVFPSLRLLYIMEESDLSFLMVKIVGFQWYWVYESNFMSSVMESFMNLKGSVFRLLETDVSMSVPCKTMIKMVVSSEDVIHSWTIPSLGVKVDAIPGRLNQLVFMIDYCGWYFGQCSEICGINHSFMPVSIKSVLLKY